MPRRLLPLVLASGLLAGCPRPASLSGLPGVGALADASRLSGKVALVPRAIQSVSIKDDIAAGATVSLIDTLTGYTVGSTVTTSEGRFVFSFGASFKPDAARSYYLEASKGVKGGNALYNQPGAEAVRLRTVLFHRNGWVSLTNAAPGEVDIGQGTTAVSAMLGLRRLAGDVLDATRLIGCLMPERIAAWGEPGFPLRRADFDQVVTLIQSALSFDQDPMRYLAYNRDTGGYLKTGTVFTLSGMSVATGRIGAAVTLVGSGFNAADPARNIIRFNGARVSASDIRVYENGTKIDLHVPAGATSGPISLEIDGTVLAGDRFEVIGSDGHATLDDAGRLLVLNSDFNTLSRVSMDGTVTTLIDAGLSIPRALTYDRAAKKLYVACYGSGKVVRFDMGTGAPTSPVDWASVPHPAGLALGPDGYLYVTSLDEGVLSRFRLSDAAQGDVVTGFERPVGVAFDYKGAHLYVAEQGAANKVTRVAIAGGAKATWAYVNTPWGLAVDSGGNVYVAANTGNAVLKILPPTAQNPTPTVTTFAAVPTPQGLNLDEAGTLYICDGGNARLLRATPGGAVYPFAFGVSKSFGFAIDASDNRYVALSGANAILKVSPDGMVSRPFAVGIANPYGLAFRDGHLYASHPDTGGITRFDLQGRASSYGRGLRYASYGLDVGQDGTAWANKYTTIGTYNSNPWRGDDQDGNWRLFPGIQRVPAFATRQDTLSLTNSPWGLAVRSGVLYIVNYSGKLVRMSPTGAASAYQLELWDDTLNKGRQVELDRDGMVLVSDNGAGIVYRYDPGSAAADHGKAAVGNALPGVYAVAADPRDNTYYATTSPGNKLYRLNGGTWQEMVLGVSLNNPTGLAVKGDGTVVLLEQTGCQVRCIDPVTLAVTTLPKPTYTPYDVDVRSDGRIVVGTDTNSGSSTLIYDLAGTSFQNHQSVGSISPYALAIDRADSDKLYSSTREADIRINAAVQVGGAYKVAGEVLADDSGCYQPTTYGFMKVGLNGAPDLHVNLGKQALSFAASRGSVYFTDNNRHLYQLTNPATGARAQLTTAQLPDNAMALDARSDGILEFVGSGDPALYQVNAAKNAATRLPLGLRKPDF